MENREFRDYAVVKILHPIRTDLNEYEFIPSCWIQFTDQTNSNVVIRYPVEGKLLTSLWILEKEPVKNEWPLIFAEFIYETDDQIDAMRVALEKKEEKSQSITNDQLHEKSDTRGVRETSSTAKRNEKKSTKISYKIVKRRLSKAKRLSLLNQTKSKIIDYLQTLEKGISETISLLDQQDSNNLKDQSGPTHETLDISPNQKVDDIPSTSIERPKRNKKTVDYTTYLTTSDESSDFEESNDCEYQCPLEISPSNDMSSPTEIESAIYITPSTSNSFTTGIEIP
ncbi:hypothetical protein B5X24_HaOG206464 [Helicoverpa armigera]|uniref:Uncharacterized protein n=1 Tax=Helicoverpa armigera TaxID=29058 RepID=A0A2W1BNY4_HELAM|nr:hypothetical protein B5X24_HaOG206464 [Helicoverpa armigera]